jgi:arylsulfatase A-like enzyme
MRKLMGRLLLGIAVSWLFRHGAAAAAPGANLPNIVLIYADDLGYGDPGCYGATRVETPHVDRLASQGLRFTSAYATAATCTPSRLSLLTGAYAWRQAGTGILNGDARLIIPSGRETLPLMLRRAGYNTAVVGKWHLGLGDGNSRLNWNGEIRPGPQEVGFDDAFIMAATGDRVPCVYLDDHRVVGLQPSDPIDVDYANPFPGEPNGKANRDQLLLDWSHDHSDAIINRIGRIGYMKGGASALWRDEDMAKVFTRKATQFIARDRQQPFFLYFAPHSIHVPRVPHGDFAGRSPMGARGDAIAEFDWSVGELMRTLEEQKLLDNTLIILTSDNGPVLDDGYQDHANEKVGDHKPAGPFRAGKYSRFEGGTRVPMIVCWQGKVQPGVSGAIFSQVDLLASLASLVGQSLNSTDACDSEDHLPALLGASNTARDSVIQHAAGFAIRAGDWKYLAPGRTRDGLGPWTITTIPEPGQLFNLADDPGETTDLAAKHPEKLKELRSHLERVQRK